ncbi:hypothetical protein SAMD00079811_71110 [Scytonema sp. HK-05]|nr:hypothetical protein SAMD00079811_71110 [Scytonema sp. HK-05]
MSLDLIYLLNVVENCLTVYMNLLPTYLLLSWCLVNLSETKILPKSKTRILSLSQWVLLFKF